ncbi:hypothetical protein [Mycobacteroides abscessus]|uniref:Putative dimethyl sulfoxide reductase subunit A n=1 Tax=Mycolicibacterium brisbanense TaxID=146020 RepID=A0A100W655_9MYCO|nr:hypothetical protein [Mycobacteroides abscessus]GAS92336.1 putative dimethyl sulfoxide reductase subunit A [Mycolicibacterium brisbanense]MDB2195035.1 hypothetical protein [Mycobacteroides abscessus subsp. abscessus]MDB2198790.1 hypothetical protein [Mycobacteroides abscessus subsp. abscessus]MDM2321119.1 hypothetical protein [Mycobacteroides abscessus]MDM2322987.1 hypothetical protein [Mycobacteroides abscessus]
MIAETVNVVIDELCHRCGRGRQSAEVISEESNGAERVPETFHPGHRATRSCPFRKRHRQSLLQIEGHRHPGEIEILNGGTIMVKAPHRQSVWLQSMGCQSLGG